MNILFLSSKSTYISRLLFLYVTSLAGDFFCSSRCLYRHSYTSSTFIYFAWGWRFLLTRLMRTWSYSVYISCAPSAQHPNKHFKAPHKVLNFIISHCILYCCSAFRFCFYGMVMGGPVNVRDHAWSKVVLVPIVLIMVLSRGIHCNVSMIS